MGGRRARVPPARYGARLATALDSGRLDIRYLRADLRLSRTRFGLAALAGALNHSRVYVQREAPALRVQVIGNPVALATDGEVAVSGRRFDFAVARDRRTVYRPDSVG